MNQSIKMILALLVLVSGVSPAVAQEVRTSDEQGVHVVRPGDTLWDLARQYLNDPYDWPRIYGLNQDRVDDPHWIFPAERLRIPGLADRGLTLSRQSPDVPASFAVSREPARTVFFKAAKVKPVGPTIRTTEEVAVPVVKEGDYYRAPLLTPVEAVRPVGQVAELLAPSVVPIKIAPQIGLYDRIFITLASANAAAVGDQLHLMRPGRFVERHGVVFQPTGMAKVEAIDGAVATAVVLKMYDAVSVGDVAVPAPEFMVPAGVSPVASGGLEGSIITFEEIHPIHSVGDLAFLNLGAQSGLKPGDEFVAFIPPTAMDWGMRPAIEVARLQVVRVTPSTSAVRVTSLEQPALEAGLPARLVRKMP